MKLAFLFLFYLGLITSLNSQITFKEVAIQKGINYIYPGCDNQEVGSGVTILDVNNDGWDDVFQASGIFRTKLWINKKGVFVDSTYQYFANFLDTMFIQSAVSGDYDNDGFTDLFVCNFGEGISMGDGKQPLLFKNMEGKYFKPVFSETFKKIGHYTSATWGDINNDGYIDLYVTNYLSEMSQILYGSNNLRGYSPICFGDYFFLNQRGKGFVNATERYLFTEAGCGLASCFTDYDNDQDVDLMVLNDFGEWNHKGNQLFRNNFPEDSFTNVSTASSFYKEMYGMGIGPGDYDNDGDLDYYVTNIGENTLLNNDSGRYFSSVAEKLGIDDTWVHDSIRGTSWSGIFFDMDLDGDLDLYISKGNVKTMTPKTAIKDPNKLYENLGHSAFKDVSKRAAIDDVLSHRGAAYFDFDHDGDLDLLSSVIKMNWADFGEMDQRIKLYENTCKKNKNWIGIKLIGDSSINKDALGSKVKILANGKKQIREVDGGSGHSSQSTKTLYFGLGKSKSIDSLEIYWPGGKKHYFTKLKCGHVYKIDTKGNVSIFY